MANYDLVVIGTGPGGYVCAIRAAQLGMKVAVVEKRKTHGGTCLNVGCIPSKALLHASELYEEARHGFSAMGIAVEPQLDLARMLAFKDEGVEGNVKGVEYLLKKNKVDSFHGTGRILEPGKVEVAPEDGEKAVLETKAIAIATGSDIVRLPGIEIDEKRIVSSTGALDLPEVPKRMILVGGGVIGLELGSVWRRLGSAVTVVEFLDRILPTEDEEISRQFRKILEKQGMTFRMRSKVTGVDASDPAVLKVSVAPADGGEEEVIETDVVLVAIGRRAYTEGLGLEQVGVSLDDRGRIVTDDGFGTGVEGIYAIGDVREGQMLAHKAEDEGVALAEILAGQKPHVNYGAIPNVVYTFPEVASVGATEDALKAAGIAYNVGKFPFMANGRAKVNRTTDGFVKILADRKTDRVLGVHIIGPDAGTMIGEVTLGMEFGAAAEDIARVSHAHPTLTESVKEAALAVSGRALHM